MRSVLSEARRREEGVKHPNPRAAGWFGRGFRLYHLGRRVALSDATLEGPIADGVFQDAGYRDASSHDFDLLQIGEETEGWAKRAERLEAAKAAQAAETHGAQGEQGELVNPPVESEFGGKPLELLRRVTRHVEAVLERDGKTYEVWLDAVLSFVSEHFEQHLGKHEVLVLLMDLTVYTRHRKHDLFDHIAKESLIKISKTIRTWLGSHKLRQHLTDPSTQESNIERIDMHPVYCMLDIFGTIMDNTNNKELVAEALEDPDVLAMLRALADFVQEFPNEEIFTYFISTVGVLIELDRRAWRVLVHRTPWVVAIMNVLEAVQLVNVALTLVAMFFEHLLGNLEELTHLFAPGTEARTALDRAIARARYQPDRVFFKVDFSTTNCDVGYVAEQYFNIRNSLLAFRTLGSLSQNRVKSGAVLQCENCRQSERPDRKLMRCGRCTKVLFCNKDCQRACLKTHKPRCKPKMQDDAVEDIIPSVIETNIMRQVVDQCLLNKRNIIHDKVTSFKEDFRVDTEHNPTGTPIPNHRVVLLLNCIHDQDKRAVEVCTTDHFKQQEKEGLSTFTRSIFHRNPKTAHASAYQRIRKLTLEMAQLQASTPPGQIALWVVALVPTPFGSTWLAVFALQLYSPLEAIEDAGDLDDVDDAAPARPIEEIE